MAVFYICIIILKIMIFCRKILCLCKISIKLVNILGGVELLQIDLKNRYVLLSIAVFFLLLFWTGSKYGEMREKRFSDTKEDIIISSVKEDEFKEKQIEEIYIEVYVSGAVKNRGVYKLKDGDRVYQAVDMAEPLESAALDFMDMARILNDGETIIIYDIADIEENGGVSPVIAMNSQINPSNGKVNINTATAQELADQLTGIGPALSQRIVDHRNNNGRFQTIEEIKNVSGIGDKKYEGIKDKITIR